MPYTDPAKQRAACAASMRKRYWANPGKARAIQNAAKFERRHRCGCGSTLDHMSAWVAVAVKYGSVRAARALEQFHAMHQRGRYGSAKSMFAHLFYAAVEPHGA